MVFSAPGVGTDRCVIRDYEWSQKMIRSCYQNQALGGDYDDAALDLI
jgi:hypothetical protein